ncbi:MAG TPA: AlkA N-terminal domain-containing protein [Hyphomicrobiales bacterium]|nr:AlkA N-terminal domain-containing protein [Hyphomicrobiales bacterium]
MNESAQPIAGTHDANVRDPVAARVMSDAELPSAATCDQARLARDPRFDGRFFTAVLTTGIYCRPICPAPPPRPEHVRYYATAAQAFAAGFRPCLRCRPESAPNSPAWRGTETTVRRALLLLQSGAAQHQDMETLSERLGVSSRHLRRLFKQHLGVSPQDYIQHRNLSFAKKLLMETQLPLLDVALASGFNSRRRFNAVFQDKFKLNPGALRKSEPAAASRSAGCVLDLHYRPPYRWQELLAFYRQRAITGMEVVGADSYARSFRLGDNQGWYRVTPLPDKAALRAEIHCDALEALQPLVQLIRRQFDLDANPDLVQQGLAAGRPRLYPQASRMDQDHCRALRGGLQRRGQGTGSGGGAVAKPARHRRMVSALHRHACVRRTGRLSHRRSRAAQCAARPRTPQHARVAAVGRTVAPVARLCDVLFVEYLVGGNRCINSVGDAAVAKG